MNELDYQKNVLARASQEWHYRLVDRNHLIYVLTGAINYLQRLDDIKKSLFYGRLAELVENPAAHSVEYLNGGTDYKTRNLTHAIIGAATESGELLEALLELVRDGKPLDEVNLQEEFGDANWYRTLALNMLSQSDEANRLQNDRKLQARFGATKFDAQRANNRDLDSERSILEG